MLCTTTSSVKAGVTEVWTSTSFTARGGVELTEGAPAVLTAVEVVSDGLTLLNTACPVVSSGSTNTWLRGGSGGGNIGRVALGGRLLDEQALGVGSSKPCIRETISSLLALFLNHSIL